MKIDEFNSLVEDLTKDRKGVAEGKREDYTKGDSDVLKNFKNQAEALGVTPETSLAVHMEKQFSAVLNYIKTDGQSESEPIIKRIGDTINYLELLWGLINEEEVEPEKKDSLSRSTLERVLNNEPDFIDISPVTVPAGSFWETEPYPKSEDFFNRTFKITKEDFEEFFDVQGDNRIITKKHFSGLEIIDGEDQITGTTSRIVGCEKGYIFNVESYSYSE